MKGDNMEIEKPAEIEQGLVKLSEDAQAIRVKDDTTYNQAAQVLLLVKDMEKKIKGYFSPIKKSAHETWKKICDQEGGELAKLTPIEKALKGEMGGYQQDQERIRKAEEDRLRAEVRKAEEARRLEAAVNLVVEGKQEKAQEVMEAPIMAPMPIIPKSTPKVAGIKTRTAWHFEITDPEALPREYMIPNERMILARVQVYKEDANIPGVRTWSSQEIAAGGGR